MASTFVAGGKATTVARMIVEPGQRQSSGEITLLTTTVTKFTSTLPLPNHNRSRRIHGMVAVLCTTSPSAAYPEELESENHHLDSFPFSDTHDLRALCLCLGIDTACRARAPRIHQVPRSDKVEPYAARSMIDENDNLTRNEKLAIRSDRIDMRTLG